MCSIFHEHSFLSFRLIFTGISISFQYFILYSLYFLLYNVCSSIFFVTASLLSLLLFSSFRLYCLEFTCVLPFTFVISFHFFFTSLQRTNILFSFLTVLVEDNVHSFPIQYIRSTAIMPIHSLTCPFHCLMFTSLSYMSHSLSCMSVARNALYLCVLITAFHNSH